jgi:hypothetical protein
MIGSGYVEEWYHENTGILYAVLSSLSFLRLPEIANGKHTCI